MLAQPDLTTKSLPHPAATSAGGYAERTVVTSDGARLAVRDYGSAGPRHHTVVLLHGLCLTQSSWALQVRHLLSRWGNRVRIVTYDHRGHGRPTAADMSSYRIDRLAADLADILSVLRVRGPLPLAGHSMGGMTALAHLGRAAANRPVEPQGLVLVATAAGRLAERGLGRLLATRATGMVFDLVSHMPRRMTEQAIDGVVRPVYEGFTRHSGVERTGAAAMTASAIHTISLTTATGFLPSLKQYDQYHALASISANTIVISGGADRTTPADHARDLAAAIPGATHLQRPTAGHMLLEEDARCVSDAIDRVVSGRLRAVTAVGWRVRYGAGGGPMMTEKVDFSSVPWGSVEWTNLVTLYLRAYESRSRRPILGDGAAAAAVDRIEYDFKRIHRTSLPASNQYLVALRARKLDDWCADFLRRHPDAVVLHLGCGLDGRAFRLAVPASVLWFDVDQPGVIDLRRRLYDDTDHYRMIGSSVSEPAWLDQVPTARPTLVVAEGLMMYLSESDVRQLLTRLTDRFDCGEMQFDTLTALAPLLSKVLTKGIIKWGIRDARAIQTWNPRLRLVEQASTLAGYQKIQSTAVRWIYRLMWATPSRNYDVLNRFEFSSETPFSGA